MRRRYCAKRLGERNPKRAGVVGPQQRRGPERRSPTRRPRWAGDAVGRRRPRKQHGRLILLGSMAPSRCYRRLPLGIRPDRLDSVPLTSSRPWWVSPELRAADSGSVGALASSPLCGGADLLPPSFVPPHSDHVPASWSAASRQRLRTRRRHVRIRPQEAFAVEVHHVVGFVGDPYFGFP